MKNVRVVKSMDMSNFVTGAVERLHPGEYQIIEHRNPEYTFVREWVQVEGTNLGYDAELFWEIIYANSMVDFNLLEKGVIKFKVHLPIPLPATDLKKKESALIQKGDYVIVAIDNPFTGSVFDKWMVIEGTMVGLSAFAWFSIAKNAKMDYPMFGYSIEEYKEEEKE